jgi:hypothetical protein
MRARPALALPCTQALLSSARNSAGAEDQTDQRRDNASLSTNKGRMRLGGGSLARAAPPQLGRWLLRPNVTLVCLLYLPTARANQTVRPTSQGPEPPTATTQGSGASRQGHARIGHHALLVNTTSSERGQLHPAMLNAKPRTAANFTPLLALGASTSRARHASPGLALAAT